MLIISFQVKKLNITFTFTSLLFHFLQDHPLLQFKTSDMIELGGGGGNRKSTVTHLRTDHSGNNQLFIISGAEITSSG